MSISTISIAFRSKAVSPRLKFVARPLKLLPSATGFFFSLSVIRGRVQKDNRRLTIKSQEGERKKVPLERGKELGNMAVILLSIENDVAKISDKRVDVYAKEAKVDDESERAAEALAVFEGSIGTGVHHEFLGELCLGKFFVFAGVGKAVGQIGTKCAFADVFHWGKTSLSLIYA